MKRKPYILAILLFLAVASLGSLANAIDRTATLLPGTFAAASGSHPAAMLLLGCGLVTLGGIFRRKKNGRP